jgi:hypothetical protein
MTQQNWFNGREFFPSGVPISTYPLSLEEIDRWLKPKVVEEPKS